MSEDQPIRRRWRDGAANDSLTQLWRKVETPALSAARLELLRNRVVHSAAAPAASSLLPIGATLATFAASSVIGAVIGVAGPGWRPFRESPAVIEPAPIELNSPPIEPAESIAEPAPFWSPSTLSPIEISPPPSRDPDNRPGRKVAPARSRSAPQPPSQPAPKVPIVAADPDSLLDESRILNTALSRWRKDKDPQAALQLMDDYLRAFPDGGLRPEADFLRINLLLSLNRNQDALALLDHVALPDNTPRAMELHIVRAELRARGGRCAEAITDFSTALQRVSGELHERALYGRYRCRSQQADPTATQDLREYLERFPTGRFHEEAAKLLSAKSAAPTMRP